MTPPETENTPDTPKNNTSRLQRGFIPIRNRVNRFIQRVFKRKPAYLITETGIETHYFNFAKDETLPFDTETYADTQIFIGNWANPWYFDIAEIENEYENFSEKDITKIEDIFEKEYVYPSQRWKLLANQNVLRDMFVGGAIDDARIMRLLYALLAGVGLLGILVVFGGP